MTRNVTCPNCGGLVDSRGLAPHKYGARCIRDALIRRLRKEGWVPIGGAQVARTLRTASITHRVEETGRIISGSKNNPVYVGKETWVPRGKRIDLPAIRKRIRKRIKANYTARRKRCLREMSLAIRAEERDACGTWRYVGPRHMPYSPETVRRARFWDAVNRANKARVRAITDRLLKCGIAAKADEDSVRVILYEPGRHPEAVSVEWDRRISLLRDRRLPHGLRLVAGLHVRPMRTSGHRPYLVGKIADGGQVRVGRYVPVPGARLRQGDVYLAPAQKPPKGRIAIAAPVDRRGSHVAALGVVDRYSDRATHVAEALIHPEHPPLRLPGGWWHVLSIPGVGD